mmetsp:Transcript_64560/g.120178  ORF Transcript_64560/g.120178 Transcript_64560/m.120178 type:complete len:290 (+) Transcript_64560:96-965(+)
MGGLAAKGTQLMDTLRGSDAASRGTEGQHAHNGHAVASTSGASSSSQIVVCFDWDCTITCRHMYKAFAGGQWSQVHSKPFQAWCQEHQLPNPLSARARSSVTDRMLCLEDAIGASGAQHVKVICREYFLGGEERIKMLVRLFKALQDGKCILCILTRGEAPALRLCFERAIPELACYFTQGWIGDTSGEYFKVGEDGKISRMKTGLHTSNSAREPPKEAILEENFSLTKQKVVLVDDSIIPQSTKGITIKTQKGESSGLIHQLDLPFEKVGIDEDASAKLLGLVRQLRQ